MIALVLVLGIILPSGLIGFLLGAAWAINKIEAERGDSNG